MDELLTNRYRALFAGYGVGGDRLVIDHVKNYLASREERYREDAMYFLLVNMDHMVVRALSGYIPVAASEGLSALHMVVNAYSGHIAGEDQSVAFYPMQTSVDPDEIINKISECFRIIEEHLETSSEERADADAVMRAIDAAQEPLNHLLWWRGD